MRGSFSRALSPCIVGQVAQFLCRLFLLVQALIIWRSCRFMGALMRSLCTLLGGIGWFVRCRIGANHCRLRHVGWEKCCHGLTSRETAGVTFLDELLVLFRYPEILCPNGIVLLGFASRVPTWRLHLSGGLPILSLMEVRRLVLFGLSRVFKTELVVLLVFFPCMTVLNGLVDLVEVATVSD